MNKQPAGLNRSSGRMWPNKRIIGWSLLTCAQKKVKLHHTSSVQFVAWDARMALLSAHVRGTAEFFVRHEDKSRRTDGRTLLSDCVDVFCRVTDNGCLQARDVTWLMSLSWRLHAHSLTHCGVQAATWLKDLHADFAFWLSFFSLYFFLSFSAVLWQHGG